MEPVVKVGNAAIGIGAGGTIVLGIWLALSYGGYDIWDGWIIAALVLWVVGGRGRLANRSRVHEGHGEGAGASSGRPDGAERRAARAEPDAAAASCCTPSRRSSCSRILILMIWKPGA